MSRSKRKPDRSWVDREPKWFRHLRYRHHVRQRGRQLIREGKTELMPKPYRDRDYSGWYW